MFPVLMLLVHVAMTLAYPRQQLYELHRFNRAILRKGQDCLFNMCEDNYYPEGKVSSILDIDNRFSESFGDIVGAINVTKITSRFNINDSENLCAIGTRTMRPKLAANVNNDWKMIVNVPGSYQFVNFEYCLKQHQTCLNQDHLPFGYRTTCEQNFIKIRMVTIDEYGELSQDYFPIPAGCTCMRVQ